MTVRDRSQVESSLERKGFKRDAQRHHRRFVYWTLCGKKTAIRTRTSHGSQHKTLGDSLLGQMARQCGGLSKNDFIKFVDCPLGREEFENLAGVKEKSKS